MSNCTGDFGTSKVEFDQLGRRVVEGRFDGGSMTSDAGVMLLGATDRKLGLMQAAARCIADPRSPLLITHGVVDMLRQRVYGLALGWEDLNDHGALRQDVAMQTAVGVDREVASAPTLCRLEKWANRATAWRLHQVLVDQFIASFKTAYAHEREKNLESALLAASKAIELAPVEPALWFHQGWLHLKVDAAEDCLNDMEQTIAKGASFGDTYCQETAQFLAAESLRRLRRYQEALAMCQDVRDDFALYVGKPLNKSELVQSCYRAMTHTSSRLASFSA